MAKDPCILRWHKRSVSQTWHALDGMFEIQKKNNADGFVYYIYVQGELIGSEWTIIDSKILAEQRLREMLNG